MWNTAISLSSGKSYVTDDEGFTREVEEYGTPIMANMLDVTRADQTLAAQAGYSVDIIAEVCEGAYTESAYFRDESSGEAYEIVRTFHPNRSNWIQLYGRRREHGKI